MKQAIETAGIAIAYCVIILVFIAIVLSGFNKVTERKERIYRYERKAYYVDIAIDLSKIPTKHLGYIDYGVRVGEEE